MSKTTIHLPLPLMWDPAAASRMLVKESLYLSGPMTGFDHYNYGAFHETAALLRSRGYIVHNPAENFGGVTDWPGGRPAYMRKDFESILRCDGIVLLPGWEKSLGAKAEALVGLELGLLFYKLVDGALMSVTPTVHIEAWEVSE